MTDFDFTPVVMAEQDPELERLVLGIPLVQPECLPALLQAVTDPGYFAVLAHRLIFQVLRDLPNPSFPVLMDVLRQRGLLLEVGGPAYLERLLEFPRSVDYGYSLSKFVRTARRRWVLERLSSRLREVDGKEREISEILAEILRELDPPWRTVSLRTVPDAGPTEWVWGPYIPKRHVTLLEGRPDAGKTWIALDLALRWVVRVGGRVLYATDEHDPSELKSRVVRLGATDDELGRIEVLTGVTQEALEQVIRARPYDLVVVDPITDLLYAHADPNRVNVAKQVMAVLRRLAAVTGAAVLAIRHWAKGVNSRTSPLNRGLGSIGFVAKARSVLHVGPVGPQEMALVHVKHNLGPRGPSQVYRLDPGADPPFAWTQEASSVGALDIGWDDYELAELERAERWLRELLGNGEKRVSEITALAATEGISAATLRRAKEALRVRSKKRGRVWVWTMGGR